MKNVLIKLVASAVLAMSAAGAAHADVYTEDFEGNFPAWESNWFGTMSNARNYYCGAALNCTNRGNNPDGIWLYGHGTSAIEVTFDSVFGASLTSFTLDVAGYNPTSLMAWDMNGAVIFNQNVTLTNGAFTDPGVYSNYTITSANGIARFAFSAGSAGNTSIDNLVAVTADAPADVPEPATLGLFGLGLLGAAFARRRAAAK